MKYIIKIKWDNYHKYEYIKDLHLLYDNRINWEFSDNKRGAQSFKNLKGVRKIISDSKKNYDRPIEYHVETI